MTPGGRRAATLLGETAAVVVFELLVARLKHRQAAAGEPGSGARHPWLTAVAIEVGAQFGDAIIHQRHRAAAAIERAVAANELPGVSAPGFPASRSAPGLPAPRGTAEPAPLPRSQELPGA